MSGMDAATKARVEAEIQANIDAQRAAAAAARASFISGAPSGGGQVSAGPSLPPATSPDVAAILGSGAASTVTGARYMAAEEAATGKVYVSGAEREALGVGFVGTGERYVEVKAASGKIVQVPEREWTETMRVSAGRTGTVYGNLLGSGIIPEPEPSPRVALAGEPGARATAQDVIDVMRIAGQVPPGMAVGAIFKEGDIFEFEPMQTTRLKEAARIREGLSETERRRLEFSTFFSPSGPEYVAAHIVESPIGQWLDIKAKIPGTRTAAEIETAHAAGSMGLEPGTALFKGALGGVESLPGKVATAALAAEFAGLITPAAIAVVGARPVQAVGAGLFGTYIGAKAAEGERAWKSGDATKMGGFVLGTAAEIGGAFMGSAAIAREMQPRVEVLEKGTILPEKQSGAVSTGMKTSKGAIKAGGDIMGFETISRYRTGISQVGETSGDVSAIFSESSIDDAVGLSKLAKVTTGTGGKPSTFYGKSTIISEQSGWLGSFKRSLGDLLNEPKWGYKTVDTGAKLRIADIGPSEIRAVGVTATEGGGEGIYAGRFKVVKAGGGGGLQEGANIFQGGLSVVEKGGYLSDIVMGDIVAKSAATAAGTVKVAGSSYGALGASLGSLVMGGMQPAAVTGGGPAKVSKAAGAVDTMAAIVGMPTATVVRQAPRVVSGGLEAEFSRVGKLQPAFLPVTEAAVLGDMSIATGGMEGVPGVAGQGRTLDLMDMVVARPRVVRLTEEQRRKFGSLSGGEMEAERRRGLTLGDLAGIMETGRATKRASALAGSMALALGGEQELEQRRRVETLQAQGRVQTGYDEFINLQLGIGAQAQQQRRRTIYAQGLPQVTRTAQLGPSWASTPQRRRPPVTGLPGFNMNDIVGVQGARRGTPWRKAKYQEVVHPGSIWPLIAPSGGTTSRRRGRGRKERRGRAGLFDGLEGIV